MITESPSNYDDLEKMSVHDILSNINQEDKSVPLAIEKAIPQIESLVHAIVEKMKKGGRLFYIGAGTSGRLGIVDASECPPTYGVPYDMVIGIIAGGDSAIRKAVENAEDDDEQAWEDLKGFHITENDSIIGIAASGTTPYVVGGIMKARKNNILTGCITCNTHSPLSQAAAFPVELIVGPEFVTGSTRMKAGTAQKLALNMISTTIMIQLGKVKGNKMIDMQLSNKKLEKRALTMIMDELSISENQAIEILSEEGSVRRAIERYRNSNFR